MPETTETTAQPSHVTTRPGGRAVEDQSLGELVATASRDLSVLIHDEVELAKAELARSAKRAGIGAGLFGGSGFLAYFGALFLSVAIAFGIHGLGLALGWGFLIVAGAYFGLAGLLALLGMRNVSKVGPPRRTIATVKDDLQWAKHPRRSNGTRTG